MRVSIRTGLAALVTAVAFFGFAGAAIAQAPAAKPPLTKEQEARVREVVREYLIANPEVLVEVSNALQAKRAAEQQAKVAKLREKIENDGRHFSVGPRNASVVMIEFFDYNCGFCKQSTDYVLNVARTRKDVRIIFKEYPVLAGRDPTSEEAARAAIASIKQGKYLQFHQALMANRGSLGDGQIDRIARRVGIDVTRMRKDMSDAAVGKLLSDNMADGDAAGVDGTPAFIVNGQFISGADLEAVEAAMKSAAATGKRAR
jgi:protein-disulfide isomerase